MKQMLPALLVGVGAVIMVWNIINAASLCRLMDSLRFKGKKYPKVIMLVYIALLIFFLIGYIIIGGCLWNPFMAMNNLMVGLILLFGSIFVLIGISMQRTMSHMIQRANLDITQALIAAVEARDANLNGHSIHVARLVRLLYRYLPREKRRALNPDDLEYAALLHDVGKLGVPESILNKKSALSNEEWAEIKKHPEIGKNILHSLRGFEKISNWVLYHHERCDGNGYYGLSYEQIPFPSRMIAVADTYSAITMHRSYRAAKNYAQASAILLESSGTQLDAELVRIFLQIPQQLVEACYSDCEDLQKIAS